MYRIHCSAADGAADLRRQAARAAAHPVALALLLAASTALAACRAATPVPGTVGDAAAAAPGMTSDASAAVTSTLGASATDYRRRAPVGPTPTVAAHLTAEDEKAMVALIRTLFGPATGTNQPDMQNPIVRQVTTLQLSAMRGEELPGEDVIGYSAGIVWIVGFKTSEPLTLSTFTVDDTTQIDLRDMSPTASLAGPDGLTSVYYIVATQSIEGKLRFVPQSQGVLVPGKSKWSLDDLAKLPATP